MGEHVVLIDGYNVIRRSEQLRKAERISLQHGRDALVLLLASRYGRRVGDITVVFDGAESRETCTAHMGISIIFSAAGCTADACIVRLAAEATARGQRVTVATDDAEIRAALGNLTPRATTQSAAQMNADLHAADRVRTKQYQHRTAIKRLLEQDADPPDPRSRRGNPRRAPRKPR